MKKNTKDWENSEEFNKIQATFILGGGDVRAIPYFIKNLLAQAREEEREKVISGIKLIFNANEVGILREDYPIIGKFLDRAISKLKKDLSK